MTSGAKAGGRFDKSDFIHSRPFHMSSECASGTPEQGRERWKANGRGTQRFVAQHDSAASLPVTPLNFSPANFDQSKDIDKTPSK
ncbi:hypothetical protein J2W35_004862 [Variovorax boronicumulans]|uniref:hypothetical protein n=1 Tax=Variovorax boronicumulans TaxID=436515 RepID=UPI0027848B6C|nr:hypothetical protein [Variovorax boronicumulans]MDQ0084493.1 hypothetical protein [Variovorax boronicumulans]